MDHKKEGTIELALYETGRATRIQIFHWLPETAYELNLVFPTSDWAEALSMFGRMAESEDVIGELIALALTEALGAEAAMEVMLACERPRLADPGCDRASDKPPLA